jgi:hypothetical protein
MSKELNQHNRRLERRDIRRTKALAKKTPDNARPSKPKLIGPVGAEVAARLRRA